MYTQIYTYEYSYAHKGTKIYSQICIHTEIFVDQYMYMDSRLNFRKCENINAFANMH